MDNAYALPVPREHRLVKFFALTIIVFLMLIVLSAHAYAQAAGQPNVTLPWGDWLASLLAELASVIGVVLLAILTWAARMLPAGLQAWATAQNIKRANQLLERGVLYALNTLGNDVKGQTISIDVRDKMVQTVLQYVIDHGPQKLIEWMGGRTLIEQKIIARLPNPAAPLVLGTATVSPGTV